MSKISRKLSGGILKPPKHTGAVSEYSAKRSEQRRSPASVSFGQLGKFLLVSKLSLVLLLMTFVVPMTAFEAHVVNVTATIERRPCVQYEVRSLGFWKTHEAFWIFPQILGPDTIATSTDALAVFNASNSSMRDKLKKQLLALKFNVAYYGAGSGLVPGEPITINDLIAQADALLTQDPPPPNHVLKNMKDRIESVNTAYTVSTCPPPPDDKQCENDDPKPSPHRESLMQSISVENFGGPAEENENTGDIMLDTGIGTSTAATSTDTATSTDEAAEDGTIENSFTAPAPEEEPVPPGEASFGEQEGEESTGEISGDGENTEGAEEEPLPEQNTAPIPEEEKTVPDEIPPEPEEVPLQEAPPQDSPEILSPSPQTGETKASL